MPTVLLLSRPWLFIHEVSMKGCLLAASLWLAVCSGGWWLVGWCNPKWPSTVGHGSSASTKELQLCNLKPLLGRRLATWMKASCSCYFYLPQRKTQERRLQRITVGHWYGLYPASVREGTLNKINPQVVRNVGENLRNINIKSRKMFENWKDCSNLPAS